MSGRKRMKLSEAVAYFTKSKFSDDDSDVESTSNEDVKQDTDIEEHSSDYTNTR